MPPSRSLEGGSGIRIEAFDPVGALEVHQIIPEAGKCACMGIVAAAIQVLPQEVKDGGEGAEVVVLLDMEL